VEFAGGAMARWVSRLRSPRQDLRWSIDPPDATPGAPFLAPADPRVVGLVQDLRGLVWVAIAWMEPLPDGDLGIKVVRPSLDGL
jgi:hypothetical protein